MGKKAAEALDIDYEGLVEYLHCNHSVYMKFGSSVYYLDCSELVPTVDEFLALPFVGGKTIKDVFDHATFYASLSGEKDA